MLLIFNIFIHVEQNQQLSMYQHMSSSNSMSLYTYGSFLWTYILLHYDFDFEKFVNRPGVAGAVL